MNATTMIRVTQLWSGTSIELPCHAFAGRCFPRAPFSAVRTARRARDAAFVLAQLEAEGQAPFLSPGGQAWLAEIVLGGK